MVLSQMNRLKNLEFEIKKPRSDRGYCFFDLRNQMAFGKSEASLGINPS